MPHQLPYGIDDDDQAREHIIRELTHTDPARWQAMTTDDRLLQTYRVLVAIETDISNEFGQRNADLDQTRAAFVARKISPEERHEAVAAHTDWKKQALAFRSSVQRRRCSLVHRVRLLHGDIAFERIRDTLITLAKAVAHHRATLTADRAATPADCALWGHLTVLDFPLGRPVPGERLITTSLADALLTYTHPTQPADPPA